MVETVLPMQGTQVQSLVRELRPYVLCSLAMPHPPNEGATVTEVMLSSQDTGQGYNQSHSNLCSDTFW